MAGTLVSGQNIGGDFVAEAAEGLAAALGFTPYHGTLNLENAAGISSLPRETVAEDFGDPNCEGAVLRPCRVGGVRTSIIRPLVPNYPDDLVEVLAPVRLRALFELHDGDSVSIAPAEAAWDSSVLPADPSSLDRFESVVFDLDGTLVDLAVDWSVVHDEIEALIGSQLDREIRAYSENELFELARQHGAFDDLIEVIEAEETKGARGATARPLLDSIDQFSCPIGICTANSRSAAELALDRFGVRSAVDAIVARQTVRPGKPEPGPLLEAFDRLEANPGDSLFVGDAPTDGRTAVGAGSSFLKADQC